MNNKVNMCSFEAIINRDYITNWTNERKSAVYLLNQDELLIAGNLNDLCILKSGATILILPYQEDSKNINLITSYRDLIRNQFIGHTISSPEVGILIIGNSFKDCIKIRKYGKYQEDIFLFDLINKLKVIYKPWEFTKDFSNYKNTHWGDKSHFKNLTNQ